VLDRPVSVRTRVTVRHVGIAAVGMTGTVVTRIRGGQRPGDDPMPVGTSVLVINDRGARGVDVERWDMPGTDEAGVAGQPGRH